MKQKHSLKRLTIATTFLLTSILPIQSAFAVEASHLEHPHSAGTFMFETAYMRMNMSGLRAETSDVSTIEAVSDFNHMMVPTDMTMDMLMLMPMYNFTKDLSTMLMVNYLSNSMDMTDSSGTCTSTMENSGLSDTKVSLNYKFMDDLLAASMELSIPTGSIDEKITMKMMTGGDCVTHNMTAPYPMQFGSGTYDVTPTLTYLGAYYSLRYGAQSSYKFRTGENDNGYTLGDEASAKLWVRKPISILTLSGEIDFTRWGSIQGADKHASTASTPLVKSSNSGGSLAKITIGAEVPVSAISLGLDLSWPIYQDLNGLQMKHTMSAAVTVAAMF